jgi:ABC-type glycerol-3-phosphate transport system substrate-binding protein
VPFLPPSVFAWDNAANNKWLISGQGALIMNPPGAWAVAVRDAPEVAEQLWTFHSPKGPKGRFDPCSFGFWGIWNFSANAAAAKSLLMYLSSRTSVEKLVAGSHGVDIPPFEKLRDFKTWEEEKPPAGTLYNYPPRGDVTALLAGYPAPTSLGTQMFARRCAPFTCLPTPGLKRGLTFASFCATRANARSLRPPMETKP